jgi:hypothetical protein
MPIVYLAFHLTRRFVHAVATKGAQGWKDVRWSVFSTRRLCARAEPDAQQRTPDIVNRSADA